MDRSQIDAALAARLVAEQFPQWAGLAVVPVELDGWDNRTFRLGDTMTVRLPSAEAYASSVAKELTWLPRLAPTLPRPVPVPVAAGAPSKTFPWPWSIRRWINGIPAAAPISDPVGLAEDIAGFVRALQRIDPADGPPAGAHSFYRGASLAVYDEETREALVSLPRRDVDAASEVWRTALAAQWVGPPVWFHGDIAPGNLLLDAGGRLAAVIDFGQCGVGDPACDLVIAWTLFAGRAREVFRSTMAIDEAMWARARGWALWKALITLAGTDASSAVAEQSVRMVRDVLADHRSSGSMAPSSLGGAG